MSWRTGMSSAMEIPGRGNESSPTPSAPQSLITQSIEAPPRRVSTSRKRRAAPGPAASGSTHWYCVIKDCGAEGLGLLSFPKPGISIALDIPVRDHTQGLVDALNELVISEGGRVYLAKDQFTRPEHFRAMEPRLADWTRIRRAWDPEGRLRSAQSVRILGDRP